MLLGKRASDRAWLADAWDVFGGHIEPGEDAALATVRELQEELGIAVQQLHWLGELARPEQGWRLQLFAVNGWSGTPQLPPGGEHSAMEWVARDIAVQRLTDAHAGFGALIDAAFARAAQRRTSG